MNKNLLFCHNMNKKTIKENSQQLLNLLNCCDRNNPYNQEYLKLLEDRIIYLKLSAYEYATEEDYAQTPLNVSQSIEHLHKELNILLPLAPADLKTVFKHIDLPVTKLCSNLEDGFAKTTEDFIQYIQYNLSEYELMLFLTALLNSSLIGFTTPPSSRCRFPDDLYGIYAANKAQIAVLAHLTNNTEVIQYLVDDLYSTVHSYRRNYPEDFVGIIEDKGFTHKLK